jgi:gas vesicle protein
MGAKSIWFAFGVGVTAGATIALLYAPQSGVKTRKQLRRGIDDAGDYLEDAGDYLKEQAEKLSGEAHKVVTQAKSKVNDLVDEAVDRSSGVVSSVTSMF